MARYQLINNYPKLVTSIIADGRLISNPTDAMVDANNAGYAKDDSAPELPEYNADTQKLVYSWAVVGDTIQQVVTIVDKTAEERIADIDSAIAQENATFEEMKQQPIMYNGHGYLPRWIYEYYTPMLAMGAAAFPMGVASVDGTSETMTYEQFLTLYQYLITQVATYTAQSNAAIAALNAQKAELEA